MVRQISVYRFVKSGLFLLTLYGLLVTTACSVNHTAIQHHAEFELPSNYLSSEAEGSHAALEWWKAFEDPLLNQFVAAVLQSNLNLEQARARLEQARVLGQRQNATRLPTLRPSLGSVDDDTPTNAGIGKQLEDFGLNDALFDELNLSTPERLALTTHNVGTAFSYELNLADLRDGDILAGEAELLASKWDYQAVQIDIIGQTIQTYFEVVYSYRQLDLLRQSVDILRERETLTESRYQNGLNRSRDLYAARLKLWNAEAAIPALESQLAETKARFWTLLGGYPSELETQLATSGTPSPTIEHIPVGVPTDLLRQRPDIGAVRKRMEAASYVLGARRADLLPTLSLSGFIGLQSAETRDWFDASQWFRNVSINLLGPTLHGAQLTSEVKLAESQFKQSVVTYQHTVVKAVNELESKLLQLTAAHQRYRLLGASVEEARAEMTLQENEFASGLVEYDTYLAAQEAFNKISQVWSQSELDLLVARLSLHSALGGVWTQTEIDPTNESQQAS